MTSSRFSRRLALTTALAVAVGLSACGSSDSTDTETSASTNATRTVTADNGEITIPTAPKRIVATGYAVSPLLEADAPLVGISTWKRGEPLMSDDVKKRYDDMTKISGDVAAEMNYEAVAQVKPDLIIIGVPKPVLPEIDLKRLETIAPVVAIGPSLPKAWRELNERQLDAAGEGAALAEQKAAYEAKAAELKTKYAGVLGSLKFGHLGGYGDPSKGNFQREFSESWGTNIAEDMGVQYYGEVKEKKGGSNDVSEYVSIEELPASFQDADVITYTVKPDGTTAESVQYALNSPLWKQLPAVKAGKAIPVRYTEAATYSQATMTLDELDKVLAPLLAK